jgi:hypothetical protein
LPRSCGLFIRGLWVRAPGGPPLLNLWVCMINSRSLGLQVRSGCFASIISRHESCHAAARIGSAVDSQHVGTSQTVGHRRLTAGSPDRVDGPLCSALRRSAAGGFEEYPLTPCVPRDDVNRRLWASVGSSVSAFSSGPWLRHVSRESGRVGEGGRAFTVLHPRALG